MVFIRHHTVAKGGGRTGVLLLARDRRHRGIERPAPDGRDHGRATRPPVGISMWRRLPDGDNWHHDSPACRDILLMQIVPFVRYYAYIEITPDRHQSLWEAYEEVKEQHPQASPCGRSTARPTSTRCSGICSRGACHELVATDCRVVRMDVLDAGTLQRGHRPHRRRGIPARYLPQPDRDHHRRADDGRLLLGGNAAGLQTLVLRQTVRADREELPARTDGAGLRDRDQLQPPASPISWRKTPP